MLEPHHQSSPTSSSSHRGQNAWSRPTSCAMSNARQTSTLATEGTRSVDHSYESPPPLVWVCVR